MDQTKKKGPRAGKALRKPSMGSTIYDITGRKPVYNFTHRGFKIAIYADGVFTADIEGLRWSLNTFNPETLGDAVQGAKHIVDHPPRWI